MRRRAFLGATTLLVLAGCTDTAKTPEEPMTEPGNTSTPTNTPSDVQPRVLVDETLYTKTRYPVELAKGEVLHFSMELKKGTICLVDVASVEASNNVFKRTLRTHAKFTYTVEYDGVHYITVQGMEEAVVRVWVE